MNQILFSRLFSRHCGHSYPVLIELYSENSSLTWYFTSNKTDILWNDNLYKSIPMSYKFPTSADGVPQGGTLEIDIDQQKYTGDDNYSELLKWFDELDDRAELKAVALINEQGNIERISELTQSHGSVVWNGEKITWNLGSDDRMNMQVNPWVFDNDSLTG